MYADADFVLALIKEDDWLQERAEEVYRENKGRIRVSKYGLLEILLVSYREGWKTTEVMSNVEAILEIDDDAEEIFEAAALIETKEMTPMDALHLVSSRGEAIISSDKTYDGHSERVKLEEEE